MRRITTNDIFRIVVMILVMGLATRVAVGLTVNERYNDAVSALRDHESFTFDSKGTAHITVQSEIERSYIRALLEVSKRHEIILTTK